MLLFWCIMELLLVTIAILSYQEQVRPQCQTWLWAVIGLYTCVLIAENYKLLSGMEVLMFWVKLILFVAGISLANIVVFSASIQQK